VFHSHDESNHDAHDDSNDDHAHDDGSDRSFGQTIVVTAPAASSGRTRGRALGGAYWSGWVGRLSGRGLR
jgi:hypothetical protein